MLSCECCRVRVDPLRRDLAETQSAEVGTEPTVHDSSILASSRRRQSVVDLVEPPGEQLVQGGRRRRDLTLRNLSDERRERRERRERTLSFALGADVGAAELLRLTGCSVRRQLNNQLPVAWATFSQRTLRADSGTHKTWSDLGRPPRQSSPTMEKHLLSREYVEPRARIELATYALRMRCSTD